MIRIILILAFFWAGMLYDLPGVLLLIGTLFIATQEWVEKLNPHANKH